MFRICEYSVAAFFETLVYFFRKVFTFVGIYHRMKTVIVSFTLAFV
jgi:hypothetical protein